MSPVETAFALQGQVLPIKALLPVKKLAASLKTSGKFRQIASSIAEVGLVEPPVVYADPRRPGTYLLLDAHLRVEVLKERAIAMAEQAHLPHRPHAGAGTLDPRA